MRSRLIDLALCLCLFLVASPAAAQLSVALSIDNAKSFARAGEPLHSGVPIPASAQLFDTSTLRVTDGTGQAVAAQFQVLGRWNGAVTDTGRPIKWVLVQFLANVPAAGTSSYTLSNDGSGNAASGIVTAESSSFFSINTGPARFHVSKGGFNLFEEAYLDLNQNGAFEANERIVSPGASNGPFVVQGNTEFTGASRQVLSVVLEESGPIRATLRVEGYHGSGGSQLLRYVTRLYFYLGKSYVKAHHTIIEGRLVDQGNTEYPNIVITDLARAGLRTQLNLAGAPSVRIKGGTTLHNAGVLGSSSSVEQARVRDAGDSMSFSIVHNGASLEAGTQAVNAWLDVSDPVWGVAIATQDFYKKSPQKLFAQSNGVVEVQTPSQDYRIYQAMGLGEQATFYFHDAATTAETLQSVMEGFASDPLFARTNGAWNRASGAFDELPPFPSPSRYVAFDNLLDANFDETLAFIAARRSYGLLNYLGMPSDRFDGATDPDEISWGNSYYDAPAAMIREYARRSDSNWLKLLAFPMAQHFYTTDMFDTDDPAWYQNGISGSRGQFHRGAWTGEYHYMESLWLYYYLSGDRRALERATQAARSYAFSPNWGLEYDIGLGYDGLTTRIYAQRFSSMADAYLATGQADLRSAIETQVSRYLARWFTAEGFIAQGGDIGENPYGVDQGWMVTQLLHPALNKLYSFLQTNQLRSFLITAPVQVARYHRVSDDPSSGDYFRFHTLVRITAGAGGAISRVPLPNGGDDFFYNSEKPGLALSLMRAGDLAADAAISQLGLEILDNAIANIEGPSVFDKPGAKYTQRLAEAVGIATRGAADPPPSTPNPVDPTPTEPPGSNPNDPPGNDPGAPPTNNPDPGGSVSIWGLNTAAGRRGGITVNIGAYNLPSGYRVSVNGKVLKHRRLNSEQFSINVGARQLRRSSLQIRLLPRRGRAALARIALDPNTGEWQQL